MVVMKINNLENGHQMISVYLNTMLSVQPKSINQSVYLSITDTEGNNRIRKYTKY